MVTPERGAVTIIPAPETTITYKIGYRHGITGKRAVVQQDSTAWFRDAYFKGYAAGHADRPLPALHFSYDRMIPGLVKCDCEVGRDHDKVVADSADVR